MEMVVNKDINREEIWKDFNEAVNMTAASLEKRLEGG